MGKRATRELPLALCVLLLGVAMFHGDATGDGMVPWLGGGALAAAVVLAATRGIPGGWLALLPLAALTIWLALSIWWSALPDRSWNYADRTFVYLAFAALGLWFAGRTEELAYGFAALLGAVVLWSLGGKVFPLGSPPVVGVQSRLDSPVGLWNQLALLGDFALPLALWLAGKRRALGTLLAFGWGVAIVLTLSRGGLAVAAIVVVAWIALTEERWDAAMSVVAAGIPAAVVAAIAFTLAGITGSNPSSSTRWHDGLIFGALLIAGGALSLALQRLPRPQGSPALRRALLVLGALVLAAALAGAALKAGSAWRDFTANGGVGNQGPRASLSSNFRWTWWKQAWHGFTSHPAEGTGAGTFTVTNLRYRTSYLDVASEPHNVAVQFLSEAGIVGFVLLVLVGAVFLRRAHGRRGHELALALVVPAYLLHSLVDINWDFVAVSAPAFLVAGALCGTAATRRVGGFATLAAAGAAALAFGALLLPWLGERWATDAFFAAASGQTSRAVTLANRARGVDPLLVTPYTALALAADNKREVARAIAFYGEATRRQPQNAYTWLDKAEYELNNSVISCPRRAYEDFLHFNSLNPYARPDEGPSDYRRALALVNAGKARC